MRWTVEGAVAATGNEIRTTVDAPTSADAEQTARSKGILVSSVRPAGEVGDADALGVDALAEAAEEAARARRATSASIPRIPDYRDIVKGAAMLRTSASVSTFIGVFTILLAILAGVLLIASGDRGAALNGAIVAVMGVAVGLGCFAYAGFVRMQAALAEAIKDIARNSFRR